MRRQKQPTDISRGIRLKSDVWAALDAARKVQGKGGKLASYDTVLRVKLGVNGKPKERKQ